MFSSRGSSSFSPHPPTQPALAAATVPGLPPGRPLRRSLALAEPPQGPGRKHAQHRALEDGKRYAMSAEAGAVGVNNVEGLNVGTEGKRRASVLQRRRAETQFASSHLHMQNLHTKSS